MSVWTRKVVIACCVKLLLGYLWGWIELGVGRRRFWGRKLGIVELVVDFAVLSCAGEGLEQDN